MDDIKTAKNKSMISSPESEEFSEELEEISESSVQLENPRKRKRLIIALVVIIVIVFAWALYYFDIIPANLLPSLNDTYQAVFLTNGQVYFGKLYRENSSFPILREVYYLQVAQSPQPLQEGQVPPANINLVKLGGELHGPQDIMQINRDQILFIEDLKSDSKVAQAIKQFQAPK